MDAGSLPEDRFLPRNRLSPRTTLRCSPTLPGATCPNKPRCMSPRCCTPTDARSARGPGDARARPAPGRNWCCGSSVTTHRSARWPERPRWESPRATATCTRRSTSSPSNLDTESRAYNALLTAQRAIGERANAELKQRWRYLRRIRLCPNRIGQIVAAIVLSTL
jgi:DDE superfamily endonuclease